MNALAHARYRPLTLATLLAALLLARGSQAADESLFHAGSAQCRIINPKPGILDRASWDGPCRAGYAADEGLLLWYAGAQEASRYRGHMQGGVPDGEGSIDYGNGSGYSGSFRNGLPHGAGTWRYADGSTLQAHFEQGSAGGSVERRYASGDHYRGGWRAGQPDGEGTLAYALGGSYQGHWQMGRRSGNAVLTYPDGASLQRSFDDPAPFAAVNDLDAALAAIPAQRAYEQLSAPQQEALRALYPILQAGDQPPYPQYGRLPLLLKFQEAQRRIWPGATLALDVLVDASGHPSDVRVLASPAEELSALGTAVLLQARYRPGRCNGQPCALRFPLRLRMASTPSHQ